jgi:hypothetical protein
MSQMSFGHGRTSPNHKESPKRLMCHVMRAERCIRTRTYLRRHVRAGHPQLPFERSCRLRNRFDGSPAQELQWQHTIEPLSGKLSVGVVTSNKGSDLPGIAYVQSRGWDQPVAANADFLVTVTWAGSGRTWVLQTGHPRTNLYEATTVVRRTHLVSKVCVQENRSYSIRYGVWGKYDHACSFQKVFMRECCKRSALQNMAP